jgi:cbb3-type cytochrome oxidase subunit 3
MTLLFFILKDAVDSAERLEKAGIVAILLFLFGVGFYLWREDMKKRREKENERNKVLDEEKKTRLLKLDLEDKNRKDKELADEKELRKQKEESDSKYNMQSLELQKAERDRDRDEKNKLIAEIKNSANENKILQKKLIDVLSGVVTRNTTAINSLTEETKHHKGQMTDAMGSLASDMKEMAKSHDLLLDISKNVKIVKSKIVKEEL